MTQDIRIDGMSCEHCVGRVQSALEAIEGVAAARVDLESAKATVELNAPVEENVFTDAVEAAGYSVGSVE